MAYLLPGSELPPPPETAARHRLAGGVGAAVLAGRALAARALRPARPRRAVPRAPLRLPPRAALSGGGDGPRPDPPALPRLAATAAWRRLYARVMLRLAIRRARASSPSRRRPGGSSRSGLGCRSARVRVIPNGVDPAFGPADDPGAVRGRAEAARGARPVLPLRGQPAAAQERRPAARGVRGAAAGTGGLVVAGVRPAPGRGSTPGGGARAPGTASRPAEVSRVRCLPSSTRARSRWCVRRCGRASA